MIQTDSFEAQLSNLSTDHLSFRFWLERTKVTNLKSAKNTRKPGVEEGSWRESAGGKMIGFLSPSSLVTNFHYNSPLCATAGYSIFWGSMLAYLPCRWPSGKGTRF